jgi:hypothetical protein
VVVGKNSRSRRRSGRFLGKALELSQSNGD